MEAAAAPTAAPLAAEATAAAEATRTLATAAAAATVSLFEPYRGLFPCSHPAGQ